MIEWLSFPWRAALLVIVWAAAIHDAFTFRIPHAYTYAVLVLLAGATATSLALGVDVGLLAWSAVGGLLALVVGIGLYAIRVMGAGDVKLFGAMAPLFALGALPALFACIAVAGLAWALLYVPLRLTLSRRSPPVTTQRSTDATATVGLRQALRRMKLPYGPAIAGGTTLYMLLVSAPG